MPEISRFFGIIIAMYYKEQAPPRFQVKYGEQRAAFEILDLELIEGSLPRRAVSVILEWAFEHRKELIENWHKAEGGENLSTIPPLE